MLELTGNDIDERQSQQKRKFVSHFSVIVSVVKWIVGLIALISVCSMSPWVKPCLYKKVTVLKLHIWQRTQREYINNSQTIQLEK